MRTRNLAIALACGALALGACGKKEEAPPAPSASSAVAAPPAVAGMQVPQADRDFATKAASVGLAEVEASRSVSDKTVSESVREFAQAMVADHGAANEELTRIAQAKQIQLPLVPDAAHQQALNDLKGTMGSESDRKYAQEFGVKAHEEAVALFERQAREGGDPELKAFAEKNLPALRAHLEHAQRVVAEIQI